MSIEKDQMLTILAVLTLCILFGLLVWLPEHRNNAGYRDRIDAAQQELGPGFDQPTAMTERDAAVKRLRQRIEEADRYVPAQPEVASLLRSLTKAADTNGVSAQDVKTLTPQHYKQYSVIPAEFEFEGGFKEAYQVIRQIESMPRLMRIDRLSLRRQDDRARGSHVVASIRLTTFFTESKEAGL